MAEVTIADSLLVAFDGFRRFRAPVSSLVYISIYIESSLAAKGRHYRKNADEGQQRCGIVAYLRRHLLTPACASAMAGLDSYGIPTAHRLSGDCHDSKS
jgi:hypothetical protein